MHLSLRWLCTTFVVVCVSNAATGTAYPATHFLGTCLDAAWAADMAASLGVSVGERGDDGRLTNPLLVPALQYPRYRVRPALLPTRSRVCMLTIESTGG